MHLRRTASCAAVAAVAAVPAVAIANTPRKAPNKPVTVVSTGHVQRGTVLVDSRGRTLYLFTKDHGSSTCYGPCAVVWPPLLAKGTLVAKQGSAVKQNLLGKVRRRNGTFQVTYNHHPLYLYSGDKRRGDMRGQGLKKFGGKWYVVGKGGNALKPAAGGGGGGCPGCPPGY
jgi:predicted lipoprotein with Yx(FWY)xxD motif